jgi:hypothetical protein
MLDVLPAWLLRLDVWELVGVIAYTQAFALLESLLIWGLVLLLTLVLPRRSSSDRFIPLVFLLIFIHSIWSGILHFSFGTLRELSTVQLLPIPVLYLLSVAVPVVLILRSGKFAALLRAILDRLAVLVSLYIVIDILSVVVILIRNL